jgi:hypothetical protein
MEEPNNIACKVLEWTINATISAFLAICDYVIATPARRLPGGTCELLLREVISLAISFALALLFGYCLGMNFNEVRARFRGGRDVCEVLVKVNEAKMSEELRRQYRIYGVKFEDTPGCGNYEVVMKHIEDAKRGL